MEQKQEKQSKEVKIQGTNSGFKIKQNGIIDISLDFDLTCIVKVVSIFQMAGGTIKLYAKLGEKAKLIGKFSFNGLQIYRDGNSRLKLQSDLDNANTDIIGTLYREEELVKFAFASAEAE